MILGIQMGHDASCAFVDDGGRILYAASEERFTRRKNQERYPGLAAADGLRVLGMKAADVRIVRIAWSKFPARFFRRETWFKELEKKADRAQRLLRDIVLGTSKPEPYIYLDALDNAYRKNEKNILAGFRQEAFRKWTGFTGAEISIDDHHLCHAASAAFLAGHGWPSAERNRDVERSAAGFADPLIVTADGCGGHLSHTTSVLDSGRIRRLCATSDRASPGNFYGDITRLFHWNPKRHCGKITGLAAYGRPEGLKDAYRKALSLSEDATHFVSEFSSGRDPDSARFEYLQKVSEGHSREDISAATQFVLEESTVKHVRTMLKKTGKRDLVLAGGVFANVKLNQRLLDLDGVDRIFVTPPMGDEGLALGAAFLAVPPTAGHGWPSAECDRDVGHSADDRIDWDMYLGPSWPEEECAKALKDAGFSYQKIPDEKLFPKIAEWMAQGLIIGWFQGRMEFGPRALGNRSILAAPFDPAINDRLNKRLSRSEFMPFAPSVLEDRAEEIFEGYAKAKRTAEFMTVTFTVKPAWRAKIPAVVHVDHTARPQTVRRAANPRYYEVIRAFSKKTGVPVILNTSFNVHEEPIVCHPREAVSALKENRVDVLVMENLVSGSPAERL